MFYGFRNLVIDFLAAHPSGYYINPRCVNGSGVETLFGQLKHTTSNLTSCNYETAKATMLTKRSVYPDHKGKQDGYRDTQLNIRQTQLRRKNTKRKDKPL